MAEAEGDTFPVPVEAPPAEPPKAEPRQLTEEQRERIREGARRGGAATAEKRRKAKGGGGSSGKAITVAQLEEDIAGATGVVGVMVMPLAPLPGGYLVKTSDELGVIVARLAADNPKLLAALTKGAGVMAWAPLVGWSAGLATAVAAQYGYVPPDGVMAEKTGVAAVYRELIRDGVLAEAPPGEGPAWPPEEEQPPNGQAGSVPTPAILRDEQRAG